MDHTDLTLRPISEPDELDLFCQLADDLAARRRRPEWRRVALRGGELVARAAWWGRAEESEPFVLDAFDLEDVPVGARLLRTARAKFCPRAEGRSTTG
ncbi:hypothetical protein [Amycolatopsis sp. GA6-003]|uniref:hypothetical protein n=1 Tax=Amycolatopsis sp. GA6-003 TaxID=2652444 RepID=UPI003916F17F